MGIVRARDDSCNNAAQREERSPERTDTRDGHDGNPTAVRQRSSMDRPVVCFLTRLRFTSRATLLTLVTMPVLGTILREIAIETFETLRVWWAG